MDYPPQYLEFVRLFNRGADFEAHEVLEELWHMDRSDFYRGLIQLAVAHLHARRGNIRGARRLLASSKRCLAPYAPRHMGLAVDGILRHIEACEERLPAADRVDLAQVPSAVLPRITLRLHGDDGGT